MITTINHTLSINRVYFQFSLITLEIQCITQAQHFE